MDQLGITQMLIIGVIFVWSGFVRSGLGFGSGLLSIPLLMFVLHDPLYFIPIIVVHSLFFTSTTILLTSRKNKVEKQGIDWKVLKSFLLIILIPKLLGVAGLISLPREFLRGLIFSIILIYALSYLFNKPIKSKNKFVDKILLIFGAYFLGTSLMGAPLIVTVFTKHVNRLQLRNTLFMLWSILCVIKIAILIYVKADFHLSAQLWLFPCAFLGHLIGLQAHHQLQTMQSVTFYRILGAVLLFISIIGIFEFVGH